MNKTILVLLLLLPIFSGCNFSPLSPEQNIENSGKIDDLVSNQNGILAQLEALKQQNEIQARDIANFQQGLINLKGNENSGVQVLQGDGPLVVIFALLTIAMILIYHYRTRAIKSEKTSEILAQQIVNYGDIGLDDKVFLSAMNSDVEKNIYDLITKYQKS